VINQFQKKKGLPAHFLIPPAVAYDFTSFSTISDTNLHPVQAGNLTLPARISN
jgi:hypothetical protein